ncbi:MAG: hypothetical protein U9R34_06250 [Nanoarchaeota archaeon]|nr:hypothetical protein [Nanoarchaeota archaeon]
MKGFKAALNSSQSKNRCTQKMKILFVCNQKNISRVAELLFKDRAETKSSGIYATGDKMLLKMHFRERLFRG